MPFKEVEYMFLLAGKFMPGMERLQGEHLFIEEEGLLFPTFLGKQKFPTEIFSFTIRLAR